MMLSWGRAFLRDLTAAGLIQHLQSISDISTNATASASLVRCLDELDSMWDSEDAAMQFGRHWALSAGSSKPLLLLSNVQDLLALNEHSSIIADSVCNAPEHLLKAVGAVGRAHSWQSDLSWFYDLLSEWDIIQAHLIRLSPAFSCAEVSWYLAGEARR
jgi:hypothetical protein